MKRTPKPAKQANARPPLGEGERYAEPHQLVNTSWVQNAAALEPWAAMFGKLDMNGLSQDLKEATSRVTKDGNMRTPEAMLYGQVVALQTIFTSLSRRAALNAGEYINAAERYLRLALKAQAQCRATIETLHDMKYPRPVAFVRQANIAHGPQQVNNGTAPLTPMTNGTGTVLATPGPDDLLPADGPVPDLDPAAATEMSGSYRGQ
jgi:hypothetical protein